MERADLENLIISTIIYYDVLGGYPLTAFELYKYLAVDHSGRKISRISFDKFLTSLNSESLKRFISQKNGFYFLKDNNRSDNIVRRRLERQKLADKKWQKTRRIVKWFQIIPYFRAVAVSGSLAINNTKEESDLDLLIIAKYGRIWTVRALLNGFTQLIGKRRHGRLIKDKICLNWFITEQSLELGLKNLSRAIFCAQLVPVLESGQFRKFFQKNQWTKEYLPLHNNNWRNNVNFRAIEPNLFLRTISRILEYLLDNKLGDYVEKILKKWQKTKIIRKDKPEYLSFSLDQMKKNTQAHLCLSDQSLIFHHPLSKNLQLERDYYDKIGDFRSNILKL